MRSNEKKQLETTRSRWASRELCGPENNSRLLTWTKATVKQFPKKNIGQETPTGNGNMNVAYDYWDYSAVTKG
jgi:hypothetical protein